MGNTVKKIVLGSIISVCLSAHASAGLFGTKLSKRDVQAVQQGQLGAISTSFLPVNTHCGVASLSYKNLQTRKTYKVSNYRYLENPNQSLQLIAVPAGHYQLVKANCDTGAGVFKFQDIAKSYGAIVVQPGEVVYPGTFSPNIHGRRLKGYDLVDHSQSKYYAILQKYPELSQRFVARPVQVYRPTREMR